MQSFDIVKILGIGLSGLVFLLTVMSYFIIKKEQERELIRPLLIKTVFGFMAINILAILIVGFFSLPLMKENSELSQQKTMLEKEKEHSALLIDSLNKTQELLLSISDKKQNTSPININEAKQKINTTEQDAQLIANHIEILPQENKNEANQIISNITLLKTKALKSNNKRLVYSYNDSINILNKQLKTTVNAGIRKLPSTHTMNTNLTK